MCSDINPIIKNNEFQPEAADVREPAKVAVYNNKQKRDSVQKEESLFELISSHSLNLNKLSNIQGVSFSQLSRSSNSQNSNDFSDIIETNVRCNKNQPPSSQLMKVSENQSEEV